MRALPGVLLVALGCSSGDKSPAAARPADTAPQDTPTPDGDGADGEDGTDGGDGVDSGNDDTGGDTGRPVWEEAPAVSLPDKGLSADALAVVFNSALPNSEAIALAYADQRGIPEHRIIGLELGTEGNLPQADFAAAHAELLASLGDEVQGLLLTFTTPYRVDCMGASAAFALGFDERWCQPGPPCNPTDAGPYFQSDTRTPWQDFGMRPAMMLYHEDLATAESWIARGLAAEGALYGLDGGRTVGRFVHTSDSARSVRTADFERAARALDASAGIELTVVDATTGAEPLVEGNELVGETDLLFYLTGIPTLSRISENTYLPGALADHLTSFGGIFPGSSQTPATAWLEAGATASYGTAIEPCNYPQKFPKASTLVRAYVRGATALEAYWTAVEWPGEGNWVGDPLARPFGSRWSWEEGVLTIDTSTVGPGEGWRLEAAWDEDGPWETVATGEGPPDGFGWTEITWGACWVPQVRLVLED